MPRSTALPLSEIPTLPLLYKLQHLVPAETGSKHDPNVVFNNIISLIRHDITSLEVSAIVNAANRSLLGGGGVDGAIHSRAGPNLKMECRALGGCETGSAKITGGYNLPCQKVIHAVGPIYTVEHQRSVDRAARLLRGCYETALRLAVENKCKSIAFSCISTGIYGYPPGLAAEVVVSFVRSWLEAHEEDNFGGIERIIFCCFERKDEDAYHKIIPEYFPPTGDQDNPMDEDAERAVDLEKTLPDPPTGDVGLEHGQPKSKKQKRDDIDEEEWGEVEKVGHSATNGIEQVSEGQKASEATSKTLIEDQPHTNDKFEDVQPVHALQKDW